MSTVASDCFAFPANLTVLFRVTMSSGTGLDFSGSPHVLKGGLSIPSFRSDLNSGETNFGVPGI